MAEFQLVPLRCGHVLNQPVSSFLYRTDCGDAHIDAPCTAWLLQGPGDPILVETGPGSRAHAPQHYRPGDPGDLLPLELARHGVDPLAVQTIVLIHLHNDHVGGARQSFAAWPILICGTALLVAAQSYATNGLATNMALLTLAGAMLYGSQPVL